MPDNTHWHIGYPWSECNSKLEEGFLCFGAMYNAAIHADIWVKEFVIYFPESGFPPDLRSKK